MTVKASLKPAQAPWMPLCSNQSVIFRNLMCLKTQPVFNGHSKSVTMDGNELIQTKLPPLALPAA